MVQSSLINQIPGIKHGFGTLEQPLPTVLKESWMKSHPQWKQVHQTRCVEVTQPGQDCQETDALYTRTPGIPVGIVTADCVPVLLARQDGGAIAAVHAGWRGTFQRILRSLWRKLEEQGEKPSQWVAAIGPSIRHCCYEIDENLQTIFVENFPEIPPSLLFPNHPSHLDLLNINMRELQSLGLAQVDAITLCTHCAKDSDGNPLFHSFRRERQNFRQHSIIGMMEMDFPSR